MNTKVLIYIALSIAALSGCKKGNPASNTTLLPEHDETNEIVFASELPDLVADTKATVVSSLSSMQVAATKGTAGSETSKWTSHTFTSDGAGTPTYSGNKWWPDIDESYHFYASNNTLSFAAAGTTVSATNSTDVICAYLPSPTYRTKNTLTFEHIFARIGDVEVTASANYQITSMTITITPKTGGTYNLRTGSGQTNGTGWSSLTTGSVTTIASAATINAGASNTTSNDLYLVPGTYTLTASWTASRDYNSTTGAYDYVHTYTGRTADVAIVGGKVNKITATLNGYATEITFGVSINAWGSNTAGASFPYTY